MNSREARRKVRREAAAFARERERDPGVIGSPDDRASVVTAWAWLAEYLAPGETERIPNNTLPLVRPDGTELEEMSHGPQAADEDRDAPDGAEHAGGAA